MMSKKGDLSLNVIIVAAIALIVLVVLVVIFTGRIGIFSKGVSDPANNPEVVTMRLSYGDCRPTTAAEANFVAALDTAEKLAKQERDVAKEKAREDFKAVLESCKQIADKASCSGSCTWS